ncbi:MAG: hypothetical protein ACE5G2_10700 [Candidatus Krumholzibacteriia bacterium]
MSRSAAIAALLVALVAYPALADFQVTGRFLYTDREFALTGFTGSEPSLPIRLADVEVVDANTQQQLAAGATDLNGNFTLQVPDSQTRDITVRVKASSSNTSNLFVTVRNTFNSAVFAVAHSTFSNHAPNQNIDFTATPVVATPGNGGDPFNVFDVILDGMDFVAALDASRPGASQSLTLFWAAGSSQGTFYSSGSRSIFLFGMSSDSDSYDDSVILHEMGHYVEFTLADSDNPGGLHTPNGCHDLRLAWSEGWATFFQNMVRAWRGFSRPEIYVDTTGQPGPGGALLTYEVETPSTGIDGSGNEVAVNTALWDIVDDAATPDLSPGNDDDPMQISDGPDRFWDVLTNSIAFASTISIEDFWDGWFTRGKGFQTEMRAIFEAKGIEYSEDTFESDDSAGQARGGGVTNATTHHTIYPAGDTDWTRFAGVAGGTYVFETRSLPCGSDTKLDLFAANGSTLLVSNDDRSVNDPSSRIAYVPAQDGALYLRVSRKNDGHTYTSYDLVVDIVVPVIVTDFQVTATGQGLQLSWRGDQEGGFSHFDVERSDAREGPYGRRNAAPIVAVAGDPTHFEFLDRDVEPGARYFYRLVGVESTGERAVFGPFEATAAAPARLVLYPARPNPFNPNTLLRFDLPAEGPVWLRVYSAGGRLVRTLVGGKTLPVGTRSVLWDGHDDTNRIVASGVYLVQIDAVGHKQTQRAVLVR